MQERTFIGRDVHARSVEAGVLDGLTGEVKSLAVPVATKALVALVCAQPTPAVAYEAGPTGSELARALRAAGVPCLVAAPSCIPRPPASASRPTAATPSGSLGSCASRNSPRARAGPCRGGGPATTSQAPRVDATALTQSVRGCTSANAGLAVLSASIAPASVTVHVPETTKTRLRRPSSSWRAPSAATATGASPISCRWPAGR